MKNTPHPVHARSVYSNIVSRKVLLAVLLIIGIFLSSVINLFVGSSGLTIKETLMALFRLGSNTENLIVWDIRLPVIISAVVVGASLGMAGCEMQTILRNPMASAYTLGLSSAASFGAALAIILKIGVITTVGNYIVVANSLLFTLLAAFIIIAFAKRFNSDRGVIILFGIALNFLFGSLTTIMQYMADENDLQALVFWSFGSLTKVTWEKLAIVAAVTLLCFFFFAKKAWTLTAMTLSDVNANSLGINVARTRRNIILAVALLAATCVSFAGPIGFIGLVAPHIARMLCGEDQRFFLPTSALIGAFFLSVASILSKAIMPGTILPIGLVTSIIGIPFFISLIVRRKRSYM